MRRYAVVLAFVLATVVVICAQQVCAADPPRGRVGIVMTGLSDDQLDAIARAIGQRVGVMITQVVPGSPADKAGIKAGNVIFAIAQHGMASPQEAVQEFSTRAGKTQVTVGRPDADGALVTVNLTLDLPPVDAGAAPGAVDPATQKKLDALEAAHAAGVLSDEEYARKKAEILAGAAPATGPAPAADVPPGFVQYRDPQGRFHLLHPREWTAEDVPDGPAVRVCGAGVTVDLLLLPAGGSAQELLDNIHGQIKGQSQDYHEVTHGPRQGAGQPAQYVEFTCTNPEGQHVAMHIVAFAAEGQGYVFMVSGAKDAFTAAQPLWETVIDSFGLGDANAGEAGAETGGAGAAPTPAGVEQYRDPQGRFQFMHAKDWTAEANPDGTSVHIAGAGVNMDLLLLPAGGSAQELLDSVHGQVKGQSQDYREVMHASPQVAGQPAQCVEFTCTNPEGQHVAMHIVAFVAEGQGYVFMVSGAEKVFNDARPLWGGTIGSFRPGGGAGPGRPDAEPGEAGPAPDWSVSDIADQQGVQIKDKNGSGTVGELRLLKTNGTSCATLLKAQLKRVNVPADQVDVVQQTPDGRFACCTYHGNRAGQAVKGELAGSIGQEQAVAEHIWAPAGSFDGCAKEARRELGKLIRPSADGDGGGGDTTAADKVALTRQDNRDSTAWMDLPEGWQMDRRTGGGIAAASGPGGLMVLVGAYSVFWTQQAAQVAAQYGQPMGGLGSPISDPLPPEQAIRAILPWVTATQGARITKLEILDTWPMQQAQSLVGQHVRFTVQSDQGQIAMEGLAYVMTAALDYKSWSASLNLMAAPQETFKQKIPLLWRIYTTYGISHALTMGRLSAAIKDEKAITEIIRGATVNRGEGAEVAAKQWDEVIRGAWRYKNPNTGEVREISGLHDFAQWAADDPKLVIRELTRKEWLNEVP